MSEEEDGGQYGWWMREMMSIGYGFEINRSGDRVDVVPTHVLLWSVRILEKLCLHGVKLIRQSKRFRAVHSIKAIIGVPSRSHLHVGTFSPQLPWVLVSHGITALLFSEVPSAQGGPFAQKVIYTHSWEWLIAKGWLHRYTNSWLPDVEVGFTMCCSKAPHGMRLKLDILAWLLPLSYPASFFSFQLLSESSPPMKYLHTNLCLSEI